MHKPQHSRYEQMVWNQRRFPRGAFFKAMAAVRIVDSELTETGFLLTHGDRGWLIASPVHHNGDVYSRATDSGQIIYGALSVLRQFKLDCIVLNEAQVIKRALSKRDFKRIKRRSDAKRFDVAMLHDWPVVTQNPYSCAIYLDGSTLRSMNPEPKERYNKPKDQFEVICPLTDNCLANALRARLKKQKRSAMSRRRKGCGKFCRLCFNEHAWKQPGPRKKGERKTFAALHGFGHEEWLNHRTWIIPDGYRYSFLQPFQRIPAGEPVKLVILYTLCPMNPPKERRIVGLIRNVTKLSPSDASNAINYFKKKGWLQKMQRDLARLGIAVQLCVPPPLDVLNIRFLPEDIVWFEQALANCDRYILYPI